MVLAKILSKPINVHPKCAQRPVILTTLKNSVRHIILVVFQFQLDVQDKPPIVIIFKKIWPVP